MLSLFHLEKNNSKLKSPAPNKWRQSKEEGEDNMYPFWYVCGICKVVKQSLTYVSAFAFNLDTASTSKLCVQFKAHRMLLWHRIWGCEAFALGVGGYKYWNNGVNLGHKLVQTIFSK